MIKLLFEIVLLAASWAVQVPEVKVAGAMKNIMMEGDLSAHVNMDTLNKSHLYGLGPVAGLHGEIMIIDGKIYSSSLVDQKPVNKQDKVSEAAMLVYSHVEKWKTISATVNIRTYADLEKWIEKTAMANGFDKDVPFVFSLELKPGEAKYHVIEWKDGVAHTMQNHKQFIYSGQVNNSVCTLLGFYSQHHHSIFTHHTTNMHVHILDEATKTVGHLDDLKVKGDIKLYLPVK